MAEANTEIINEKENLKLYKSRDFPLYIGAVA